MANDDKKDERPVEGDTYTCKTCSMGVLVTKDCRCDGPDGPFFTCCGEQMEKASREA